jgi:hypothetical protein
MLQTIKKALLLALFLVLPSCGAFNFHGQDLALRHDAEQDTLELELIYKSVEVPNSISTPSGSKTTGQEYVLETIEKIAEGKRYFMLCVYGIAFDIDMFEMELRKERKTEEGDSLTEGIPARALAVCESLSIQESQVFVTPDKRLGIRQKILLTDAKRALETLNMAWHLQVITDAENGRFERDSAHVLDRATRAAFLKEAKEGVQWLKWSGADLVLSLPVNTKSAALLLHALLEEQESMEDRNMRAVYSTLFGLVSELSTEDGRLTISLGANNDGSMRMELVENHAEYKRSLLEGLQAKGFEFAPDPRAN